MRSNAWLTSHSKYQSISVVSTWCCVGRPWAGASTWMESRNHPSYWGTPRGNWRLCSTNSLTSPPLSRLVLVGVYVCTDLSINEYNEFISWKCFVLVSIYMHVCTDWNNNEFMFREFFCLGLYIYVCTEYTVILLNLWLGNLAAMLLSIICYLQTIEI